jgi:Skp family chaperone for outer membrane proteins
MLPDDPKAEQIKAELRGIDREVQDLGDAAKKYLTKMQDDMAVQIYREVNEAVTAYARANDIELVMHYNDAITPQDMYNPANVQRKLQFGGCFPMYYTPGMNITDTVIAMLNQHLRSMQTQTGNTQPR